MEKNKLGHELASSGSTLDELAADLLREANEYNGRLIATYRIKGELMDLVIDLGRKFANLFPAHGQPLPDEAYYEATKGITPITFSGLPEDATIEAFREKNTSGEDGFYGFNVVLDYIDEKGRPWALLIGKDEAETGISRTIEIPERKTTGYNGQGSIILPTKNAEERFADTLLRFRGELDL